MNQLIAYIVAAVACKGPAFQGCIKKIKDATNPTTTASSTTSSTTAASTAATTGGTTGASTTDASTTGVPGTTGSTGTTGGTTGVAKQFTQTAKLNQQDQLSRAVAAQAASPELTSPIIRAVKKALSVRH